LYRETSTSGHELRRDEKKGESDLATPACLSDSAVEVPLDSKFLGSTQSKVLHPQFMSLNEEEADKKDHIIVAFPIVDTTLPPLVRIHSECLTGDLFGSLRCDCGPQLRFSVEQIEQSGGYLIYLRQEGRGIGLRNKLKAYRLQDEGFDTFAANEKLGFKRDERDFEMAAKALKKLGIHKIRLITKMFCMRAALMVFCTNLTNNSMFK
jgi:GTP cyclohydrolase II